MVGSFGHITFLLLRSSIFARRPSLRLGTLCSVALVMTAFQSLFALPGGQLRSDSIVWGPGGTAPVKMLWGERRGHGTMGAVQRLPMELTHVATFSF
jgi:hypothetical protein